MQIHTTEDKTTVGAAENEVNPLDKIAWPGLGGSVTWEEAGVVFRIFKHAHPNGGKMGKISWTATRKIGPERHQSAQTHDEAESWTEALSAARAGVPRAIESPGYTWWTTGFHGESCVSWRDGREHWIDSTKKLEVCLGREK